MTDSIDPHILHPASTPPTLPRVGCLFQLSALAGAAFVVTILAYLAATLGNSVTPAGRWLDRNITTLIAGELAAMFVFGVAAMNQDRRRTLREQSLAATMFDKQSTAAPKEARE